MRINTWQDLNVKSLGGSEFTVCGKAIRGLKVSQVVLQIISLILLLIYVC